MSNNHFLSFHILHLKRHQNDQNRQNFETVALKGNNFTFTLRNKTKL